VTKYNREYWKLKGLDKLNIMHKETNGNTWPLWRLYQQLVKKKGTNIAQVVNVVEIANHKLPHMETLYIQAKDQAEKMQHAVQRMENDIEARKKKISALDKTAFSCEQNCKRTEQKVQVLTDKKDRLERLIANILNGEDYAKLKSIVKEIVKAVLANNKQLISISFVALIQTLKDNPEIVELIQNIHSANDSEQHKGNENNITKYLELNKDRILNLGEKNYENLVQALTNDVMNNAANSSYNPMLSLSQSSSMFPKLSTQVIPTE
jgi:septal ring factor EnvC (AmiA/AmiB activator)